MHCKDTHTQVPKQQWSWMSLISACVGGGGGVILCSSWDHLSLASYVPPSVLLLPLLNPPYLTYILFPFPSLLFSPPLTLKFSTFLSLWHTELSHSVWLFHFQYCVSWICLLPSIDGALLETRWHNTIFVKTLPEHKALYLEGTDAQMCDVQVHKIYFCNMKLFSIMWHTHTCIYMIQNVRKLYLGKVLVSNTCCFGSKYI